MDDLLTTIHQEVSAPKHATLKKSCKEALDILEDEKNISNLPVFQLRAKCLEPLQLAIESKTTKLVCFGIGGIQRMVNDARFQSNMESERSDRWMPIQIINSLSSTPNLPEDTQVEVMKVLLNMTFSNAWCTNAKVITKIAELCLNCYLSCSKQFLRQACIHTVSQTVGACYRRASDPSPILEPSAEAQVCIDTFIASCQSSVRTAIRATLTQMLSTISEKLSDTTVQMTDKDSVDALAGFSPSDDQVSAKTTLTSDVVEILQFLCDRLTATHSMNQYKPIVPLLLEGVLAVLKNLPPTIKDDGDFVQLLWKQLCPSLIAMLGNPKTDKSVVASHQADADVGRGSGCSSSAPSIAEASAKTIYSISVELVKLVGSLRSLRPVLESVFHRMLLYPPPHHRLEALKIIKELLTTPEGILALAGPTIPDDVTKLNLQSDTLPLSNIALLKLILDSIQECCQCNESAICFTSVSCVDDLLKTIEQFTQGECLNEFTVMNIMDQFAPVTRAHIIQYAGEASPNLCNLKTNQNPSEECVKSSLQDGQNNEESTDVHVTAVPGAAERAQRREEYHAAERQMANDYILRILQILPSLLEKFSVHDLDESILTFSSNFCTSLLVEQQKNTKAGEMVPLLNADGVYIATYHTLLLNLKMIKCGYYDTKDTPCPVTKDQFISTILHGDMLLFLSDTWLTEVYQQVTKLNLLQMTGYNPSMKRSNALLNTLMDIDGIESRKLGGQLLREYAPAEDDALVDSARKRTSDAGMRFSKAILVTCWDGILDVLSVLLNGKSSCGITGSLSLLLGTEGAKEEVKRAQEAICMSLDGLQRAARLACMLGLQNRCGTVFAQLANASCVIEDYQRSRSPVTERKPNIASKVPILSLKPKLTRLHAAHALSLDVVLSTGFEMGSHAADCWAHVLRCCAHVSQLEHMYFSSGNNQAALPKVQPQQHLGQQTDINASVDEHVDLDFMSPPVVPAAPSPPSLSVPDLIAQNSQDSFKDLATGVLSAAQTSQILCSLSQQVDRLFEDVANKLTMESLINMLKEFCKISSQQLFNNKQLFNWDDGTSAGGIPTNALHLYRLGYIMLKCIKSNRPLMHVMRAWCTVAPHFVEAACHSDRRISKKAVACMHDFVTTLLSGRQELAHFHFNELLCKPFENLLCMDMCDGDVQDQIVCSICELVEACTTEICSGWRPLFAALRAVKVEFTTNEEINEARERHVTAVLDVFEVFLNTDNVLVFANAAVDCVMCLLKYVKGPGEFGEGKDDDDDSDSASEVMLPETAENLCLPALKYLKQCSVILARMWNMPACPIFHGAHSIQLNALPKCVDPVIPNMNLDAFQRCFHNKSNDYVDGIEYDSMCSSASLVHSNDSTQRINISDYINNGVVHYSSQEYFSNDENDYDGDDDDNSSSPDYIIDYFQPSAIHAGGCYSRLDIPQPTKTLAALDNHTGVLHVWFLLLEGLATSVSQCPKTYQPQALEMLFDLLRSAAHTPGPEFGIHCVNHLLLPMLQSWLRQCTRSYGYWEGSPANFKQCCGLCTDLVVEYIVQFVGHLEDLSGLEFMLKQLLDILVECIAQPIECIARLGCSCIRHALLSGGPLYTEEMWHIATESLLHAFHVTMYSTRQLMTLFHANSENFYGDIGQVKVAARKDSGVTECERLKQLAVQVFLLDSQRSSMNGTEERDTEKDRSFVFLIYPPEHKNSINPDHILSRVSFRSIVVGLLSHQLLLQTVGAILLQGCNNITNNERHLLRRSSSTVDSAVYNDSNLPGLLSYMSTRNIVTLLQCLQESYKMAVDFDSRPGLKFLIQKVAKAQVAANLYKQAGVSMTFLLHALMEICANQSQLTAEQVRDALNCDELSVKIRQINNVECDILGPMDCLTQLESLIETSIDSISDHVNVFVAMLRETCAEVCNTYIAMVLDKEGTTIADRLSEQPLFFLVAQPDEISELKREKSLMTIVAEKLKQQQQQQQPQTPFSTAAINIQGNEDAFEFETASVTSCTSTQTQSSPQKEVSKREERAEKESKVYTVATDQTIKNLMSEYKKRKQQHSMPQSRRKISTVPKQPTDQETEQIEKQQKSSIMKDSEAHMRSWTEMICTFLSLLEQLNETHYVLLLPIVFPDLNQLIRHADDVNLRLSLATWVFKLGKLCGVAL